MPEGAKSGVKPRARTDSQEGPSSAERRRTDAEHRRTKFLAGAGTALLSSTLNVEETLERVAHLAVPAVADWCVLEVPSEELLTIAHADAGKIELARDMRKRYPPKHDAPRGVLQVLRTGQPELYIDVSDELLAEGTQSQEHLRMARELGIRSVMIVPLTIRGDAIGAITFVSSESGHYGEEDLEMAQRLAQKASLAIENARLFRRERQARAAMERAAERMARLQALTGDLATALTSEAVAQVVIEHSTRAVSAASAAIWVLEPDGLHIRLLRSWNYPPETMERFERIDVSGSAPVADAMRRRAPVFIESNADYRARYPDSASSAAADLERMRHSSYVCLPLFVGAESIGALAIAIDGEHTLDSDERAFLTVSAGHCAQSFYRARIYEAERRARAEMALLYELVDAVSRASTIDQVYERALTTLEKALDVERSSILLFDPDRVIRFKASHGLSQAYRDTVEGHSPWSPDTTDAAPVVVPDVAQEPSLSRYMAAFAAEHIGSLAFLPLIHQQRLLGKLMIYAGEPRAFSAAEIALARSVAAQVAHAVARKLAEVEIARLFEEAETARADAEQASRMKDEFLAVVSHELRTPMSAILGWSHILHSERRNDPETLNKGLDVIERNARAQTKIIEDILDVSRIITGKLVIDARPVSLTMVVTDALDVVRASATAKEIALSFGATDDPFMIVGDAERLRQIVWNLLSNAIKFTPRGGVVEAELERENNAILLIVRDSGRGISPAFLPHVFERFRQADASTTRLTGGLGLGLAIVRHLVELHGGQVRAGSEGEDRGATFTVALPIRALQPNPEPQARGRDTDPPRSFAQSPVSPVSLHGVRIVVVDDERDAREMLEAALQAYGADVQTEPSTRAALEACRRFAPHVIVSDIGMPYEDGYALIRQVRAGAGGERELVAIALTAYARPEDRKRALDAGYDEHLSKPANPEALAMLIASMRKARQG
jgi:signal transduction histidine kinase